MLDFIGITIIIVFFVRGYMKGIIVAVFSVLAIVLGVICALKLSGMLSQWLLEKDWVSSGWAQLISYAILFVGVLLLVRLIAKAIQATAQLAMLGWLNGVVGGLLYGFLGAFIWSSLLWLGDQMRLVAPETKEQSKTYAYLVPVAPWVIEKSGKLLPFAKDIFADLEGYFDDVHEKPDEDVGTDR